MPRSLVVPDPAAVPGSVPRTSERVPVPVRDASSHVAVRGMPAVVPADCERLDVYRVAVEFQLLAASVGSGRRLGALRDQLDRASVSIVLNIAEGSGRFTPADKAQLLPDRARQRHGVPGGALAEVRAVPGVVRPLPALSFPVDARRRDAHPPGRVAAGSDRPQGMSCQHRLRRPRLHIIVGWRGRVDRASVGRYDSRDRQSPCWAHETRRSTGRLERRRCPSRLE
jgi:hypothetical protein